MLPGRVKVPVTCAPVGFVPRAPGEAAISLCCHLASVRLVSESAGWSSPRWAVAELGFKPGSVRTAAEWYPSWATAGSDRS